MKLKHRSHLPAYMTGDSLLCLGSVCFLPFSVLRQSIHPVKYMYQRSCVPGCSRVLLSAMTATIAAPLQQGTKPGSGAGGLRHLPSPPSPARQCSSETSGVDPSPQQGAVKQAGQKPALVPGLISGLSMPHKRRCCPSLPIHLAVAGMAAFVGLHSAAVISNEPWDQNEPCSPMLLSRARGAFGSFCMQST